MRLISIDKAHQGHSLQENIFNTEGQCLYTTGIKLAPHVIERLRQIGYRHLLISDAQDSGIEGKPLISDGLRLQAVRFMHKTCEMLSGKTDVSVAPELDVRTAFEISNSIVDEVALGERGRVVDVPSVKTLSGYGPEHAVSVAVYSAYTGGRLGYNLMQLRDLVLGALLHDIGELFLPREIIHSAKKMAPEEFATVQQHGALGFKYLSRFDTIKATSRAITIQHHERVTGKGYPKGLLGHQIHPYSGIVGACDIYDAMTSDRPYRARQPAIVALGVLMSSKEALFAPELREIFSQLFAPFPIGTWVTLSDGHQGIVKSVPKATPSRPDVKVIYDSLGQLVQSSVVKLSQTPDLRIAGIPTEF